MNSSALQFTVVICAYTMDRWNELMQAVRSVQQQTYPAQDIVLVIDGNKPLYERASAAFPTVSVIFNSYAPGLSGARNSGIARATAEIVAFLDDDACAAPEWLEHLAGVYETLDIEAVGGQIIPIWARQQPWWFPDEFGWVIGCTYTGMPSDLAPVRNLIGCNMSIRVDALRRIGGFRTGRVGSLSIGQENDETDLCIRLQVCALQPVIYYQPLAIVSHHVSASRTTIRYFLTRCISEGLSKARLRHTLPVRTTLSTETAYTVSILPRGIARYIWQSIRGTNSGGFAQALAIILGFGATLGGYVFGWVVAARPYLTPAQDRAGSVYEPD